MDPQNTGQTELDRLLELEPQERIEGLVQAHAQGRIQLTLDDYYTYLYYAYFELDDEENTMRFLGEAYQAATDNENRKLIMFDEVMHWLGFERVEEALAAFERFRHADFQEAGMTEMQVSQLEKNMHALISLIHNDAGEVLAEHLQVVTEPVRSLLLARICMDQGRFGEAEQHLLQVLKSQGTTTKMARKLYDQIQELRKEPAAGRRLGLGEGLAHDLGKLQTYEPLRQIERLREDYANGNVEDAADYYISLSLNYYKLDDLDSAIHNIREAFQVEENNADRKLCIFGEIQYWLEFDRVEEALSAFERFRTTDFQEAAPTTEELAMVEADLQAHIALIRNDETRIIREHYDSGVSEPLRYLLLARLHIDEGQYDEAEKALTLASQFDYIEKRIRMLNQMLEKARAEQAHTGMLCPKQSPVEQASPGRTGWWKGVAAVLIVLLLLFAVPRLISVMSSPRDSLSAPAPDSDTTPASVEVPANGFRDEQGRVIHIGMALADVEEQFDLESGNHLAAEDGSAGYYNGISVIYSDGVAGILTVDVQLAEGAAKNWFTADDIGIGDDIGRLAEKYGEPDGSYIKEDFESESGAVTYDLGGGDRLVAGYVDNRIFYLQIDNDSYDYSDFTD